MTLSSLKQEIIDNKVCPHLANQATQLVFGSGNEQADIVFIGEAPGKKEDETGLPFVGASGKFLDELLGSVNLSRDDIYITNIVKYRPPNNRDPSMEEKAAFLPYLMRQLELIQPKVIVTLGRHSMEQFLPQAKIGESHGKEVKLNNNFILLPLYHPAAAIYNRKLRQVLFDDIKMLEKYK